MNIVREKLLDSRSIRYACGAVALFSSIAITASHAADTAKTNEAPKGVKSRITGVVGNPQWREEFAYHLGVKAYTYAFPWYYNALLRYQWTVLSPPNPNSPSFKMNEFWHARQLVDASWKYGGGVNNDTLYSASMLDVSEEPIILSHPDMGDRYFTFQLVFRHVLICG